MLWRQCFVDFSCGDVVFVNFLWCCGVQSPPSLLLDSSCLAGGFVWTTQWCPSWQWICLVTSQCSWASEHCTDNFKPSVPPPKPLVSQPCSTHLQWMPWPWQPAILELSSPHSWLTMIMSLTCKSRTAIAQQAHLKHTWTWDLWNLLSVKVACPSMPKTSYRIFSRNLMSLNL